MFTADDVHHIVDEELDARIKYAVRNYREGNGAYIRVHCEDSFFHNIKWELERRGFKNVSDHNNILTADIYFEW